MGELRATLTVRRAYDKERAAYSGLHEWVVINAVTDEIVVHDGIPVYGGITPSMALADAHLIAAQNNADVKEPDHDR